MNFGDALVVFFYLYEKNKTFKKNDESINKYLLNVQSNYKIKIIFILFWCTFLDLIDSFDYSYNYDIKKIDADLIKYLKDRFKCFFIFLNEYNFVNIQTYVHQRLGINFNIFCLLVTSLFYFINNEKNYHLVHLFLYLL